MTGFHFLAFLAGLAVGRFLVVVVVAVPDGAKVREQARLRPGCACSGGGWGRIPVLWWLRNRGKCPQCRQPANADLALVEPVTAAACAGTVHFVGLAWPLPAYLWFVFVTIALGFADLRRRCIPNRILAPGVIAGMALLVGGAVPDGRIREIPEAVASGAGYFLMLLVPALLTRGAIGMGDVKLAFLLGLFAGYGGWESALLAGAGSFALAGAVVILLLMFRVLSRSDQVPFGPFMVASSWIAIADALAAGGHP